jgi:hypothetical protein
VKTKSLLLTVPLAVVALTFLALPAEAVCWAWESCAKDWFGNAASPSQLPPDGTLPPRSTTQSPTGIHGATSAPGPVGPREKLTPAKKPKATTKVAPPAVPPSKPEPAPSQVQAPAPAPATPAPTQSQVQAPAPAPATPAPKQSQVQAPAPAPPTPAQTTASPSVPAQAKVTAPPAQEKANSQPAPQPPVPQAKPQQAPSQAVAPAPAPASAPTTTVPGTATMQVIPE